MKKFKNLTAFLLIITLITQSAAVMALVQSETVSGDFVIADFGSGGEEWVGGNMTNSTDVRWSSNSITGLLETYYDATKPTETSKYLPHYGQKLFEDSDIPSDWSNVEYINMWIYNPSSNAETGSYLKFFSNGYYLGCKILHNFSGWKLVSLPTSGFTVQAGAQWSQIDSIQLLSYDWHIKHQAGEKLYFAKIWASSSSPGGIAQTVYESHPSGLKGVLPEENIITVELDSDVFSSEEDISITIVRTTDGITYTPLQQEEYMLEIIDSIIYISMNEELEKRSKYKVSIGQLYTTTAKSFSWESEFETIGYKGAWSDSTLFKVFDSDSIGHLDGWTGGNMTRSSFTQSGYMGEMALLKTYFDDTKENDSDRYKPNSGQIAFAKYDIPSDWIDVDSLNLWIYSPQASDTSKFAVLARTAKSYFIISVPTNFEGWKLVNLKKEDFTPRDNDARWEKVESMLIATHAYGSKTVAVPGTEVYFKEIWTAKESEPIVKNASIKNGECDVSVATDRYILEYDELIYNAPYSISAKLYKYGQTGYEETEAPTIEIDKGRLDVNFTNPLEKGTRYKLDIEGLYLRNGEDVSESLEFTTTNSQLHAIRPQINESNEGGNVTVQTKVNNEGADTVKGKLVARLYTAEGSLLEEKITEEEIESQSMKELSVEFSDVYSQLDNADTDNKFEFKTEAFVLDSENANAPIIRYKGVYPDNQREYENSAELENGNIKYSASIRDTDVVVSGSVSKEGVRPVCITVKDSQGAEILLYMCETDAEGKFNEAISIGDVISTPGNYKVVAGGFLCGTDEGNRDEFYYADNEMKNTIIERINGAASPKNTAYEINEYQAAIGLPEANYTDLTKYAYIAETVFEQKPYDKFSELTDIINKSQELLSQLNEKSWMHMADFMETNKDIIIYGNEFDTTFFNKGGAVKNSICFYLADYQPFYSFRVLRAKLSDSINRYYDSQKPAIPGGNGGGGGGGSAKIPGKTFAAEKVPSAGNKNGFKDLSGFEWAEEAITVLLEKGIVSASNDGNFRPADAIKREEFLKMLVEALKIPVADAKSVFSDSVKGAWYESYLATAKERGIINGRDDGSFGVGNTILRQDMAVMIYRAIEMLGTTLSQTNDFEDFCDKDSVSTYATEAVEKMQALGFISGMGDGRFAPLETASRAQAAIIMYRIINAVREGGK